MTARRGSRSDLAVAPPAVSPPGPLLTFTRTALVLPYAVLLAALLLAVTVVTPPGWLASRAAAAEDPVVLVQLDDVDPLIAGPGVEVRLTGSITNAGPAPVAVDSIRVSTAYRGLDTRGEVQRWASEGLDPTPILLGEDGIGATVMPGSRVRFFVDIPPDALDPGFQFATLPVRIDVTAQAGAGGEEPPPLPGGELRTFLPWQAAEADQFNPVDIAWVAPLTLPAGEDLVDPDESTRDAAWDPVIGPASRTAALLDGLADTSATFMIDPALLNPLNPVASLTEVVVLPGADGPESEPTPQAPETPPAATAEPAPTGQESSRGSDDSGGGATGGDGSDGTTGDDAVGTADSSAGADSGPIAPDEAETTSVSPEDPLETPEPVIPPTPVTMLQSVQGLRQRIAELPQDRVWWLPVGDTDTGALLELDAAPESIAALVARPPAQPLPTPGRTDMAWPLGPGFDNADVQTLRAVWAQAGGATGADRATGADAADARLHGLILPSAALADSPLTERAVRQHASGSLLIGYDERLSGLAAAGGPEGDGRTVQRFLAETMAIYQEQPAMDRSTVVAIPRSVAPTAATLQALTEAVDSAPWLTDTSVEDLMASADGDDPVAVRPVEAQDPATGVRTAATTGDLTAYSLPGASPLTSERITRVEDVRSDVVAATEVVPGTEEARETWLRALDQQYSARWRQGGEQWAEPVETAAGLATEVLTGVRINPTTINFLADEGVIRITVVNELPLPVEGLRMTVSPGNARLRILAQPEPITIGPESRATVQFRARAVAAGQVPLNTSLSTPNGTPVGEMEKTQVRVQPTGVWIYWLLGGVAGVILVLGLVRALRPSRGPKSTPHSKETPGSDLETT